MVPRRLLHRTWRRELLIVRVSLRRWITRHMVWQAPPLPFSVTVTASIPATVSMFWLTLICMTVPQMWAGNILHDMAEFRCGLLALVPQRGWPWTACRSSGTRRHGRRTCVDMSVERIAEVSQSRTSRVHAPLVICIVRFDCDPRAICLLLVLDSADLLLGLCSQSFRDALVPCYHVLVRARRKALSGEDLGQDLAVVRVLDIPMTYCFHKEL
jgi:hypothetical protein